MFDPATFWVFLIAAATLAVLPGPGMAYVLTRTLRGGRREGVLSTIGTGLAGLVHTVAAALGVSAILATSATAFAILKWAGAAYLVYLGVRTLLTARQVPGEVDPAQGPAPGALRQGVIAELLNPKTALFFLAFLPQFVDPAGPVFVQFVLLGAITTALTSGADLVIAFAAGPLARRAVRHPVALRVQRAGTGAALIGLGAYVALDR